MSEEYMENGYLHREKQWYDERFHAPREQSIKKGYGKTLDAVVVVDTSVEDYPRSEGIYKVDVKFADLIPGIWEEIAEHRFFLNEYRKGYKQKRDRFMMVYPSGDNHRVKNVSPNRYDIIKNYNDGLFGVKATVLIHLPTGTWVYFHENKPAGDHVNQLVDRILRKVIDDEGEDRSDYVVEMAISFKGPGCILGRHRDHDDNNAYHRYHAILQSNPKNYIATGNTADDDYVVSPRAGEIWVFAVEHPHWAGNDSKDQNAWHLVIDVIRKETLQSGDEKVM